MQEKPVSSAVSRNQEITKYNYEKNSTRQSSIIRTNSIASTVQPNHTSEQIAAHTVRVYQCVQELHQKQENQALPEKVETEPRLVPFFPSRSSRSAALQEVIKMSKRSFSMYSQENSQVMQVLPSSSDSVIQESRSSNGNSKYSILHLLSSCPPERFNPSYNTNNLPLSFIANRHRSADRPPEVSMLNNKYIMSDYAPAGHSPDWLTTCNINNFPGFSCITYLYAPSDHTSELSVVLNNNVSQLSNLHYLPVGCPSECPIITVCRE